MNTHMHPSPHRRAGQGLPLVLVHGFLGGSRQWEAEIAHFSERFDVIAPDLSGFGEAADKQGYDTIGEMAESVLRLLDQLAVKDFMLLGHSMGGMIVQEIAARAPTRVSKLILYGTGPLGLMPDRFEPIEQSRQRLISDGVVSTIHRIGATWFHDGTTAPGFTLVEQLGARANHAAAVGALDAMAAWDGRAALSTLTMPTLIIWGDEDRSYRWPQIETLQQTLPDARLAIMPGASHAAHLEQPELFHAIIDDFLSA